MRRRGGSSAPSGTAPSASRLPASRGRREGENQQGGVVHIGGEGRWTRGGKYRGAGGLENEDVSVAHVFAELDIALTIVEAPN